MTLKGLSDAMAVSEFRQLVARQPMALQAWREDATAADADGAKKEAKPDPKKDPKSAVADGDEELPTSAVLLLGVGKDLESETEGASPLADAQVAATAAIAAAVADKATAHKVLVHLRDGRCLGEYGLEDGSIVFLVFEGKAA